MSVPDPLGRDRLAAGAAMYKPPVHGLKKPKPPFYRGRAFQAALVVAALVASFLVYQRLSGGEDTPQSAATTVIRLFLAEDYSRMRRDLCSEDRAQVGTNDLESAGRSAGPLLRTYDKAVVDSVTPVTLTGSDASLEARQVSGRITAKVGDGTDFKVVTVREGGTWHVCLTPGGYSLSAFNLDVPIGGDAQSIG